MDLQPPDAQELRFRLAMLRMSAAEFRRSLRRASTNLVAIERIFRDGDPRRPRRSLPWLWRGAHRRT